MEPLSFRPLLIGGLRVDFPFVLAPMAGYTDAAMRAMCRAHGCGLTYTEVANAEGLARRMPRTVHLLETVAGERPVLAHLYGSNPDAMARAAAVVQELDRFDGLDINCGCPVRKIVAKGAGAALMKHPARIEAIVRAVRAAVSLPVSVKTRIGYAAGAPSAEEVARAAEAGGAQAIAVHARLASAKHGGPANWDALARVKGAVAIPVIGNGGVDNAADALRMLRETGVDGVMIGRGAIGRPWIFAEIATLAAGRSVAEVTPPIRRAIIAEHLERLVALKAVEHRRRRRKPPSAETAAVLHFRGHLHRYLAGLPGWPAERRRFNEIKTAAEVLAMVDRLLGLAPADRGSACGLARKVRGATE